MRKYNIKDLLLKIIIFIIGIFALIPVVIVSLTIIIKGAPIVFREGIDFLTKTAPPPGGPAYGIAPAIIGSALLGVLASVMGIPIAIAAAVMIRLYPSSRLARVANVTAKSLMELPTVLIGMLVYILIVIPMHHFSILAGSIALAIVLLPYVLTYVEEALEQVPYKYLEAGYSLGMSKSQVASKILLGVARRGLVLGVLMGLTKALGETAPLLFTVGSARNSLSLNPLRPGDAIPLLIFDYIQAPYDNYRQIAWGAGFILFTIFLALYILSKVLAGRVKY